MNLFVNKKLKVEPGFKFYGKQGKKKTKNLIGLKRNKIDNIKLKFELKRFKELMNTND